jgi:mono/diheme cytochrome c family protein
VWRALFFSPGATPTAKPVSAEWARGEYLVRGLGHCAACHSPRNAWGATRGGGHDLQGGLLPLQQWYAPALTSSAEAGVAHWQTEDVVALLRTGQAPAQQAGVSGPMADVVFNSTQHLTDADARAMAHYLQALPQQAAPAGSAQPAAASAATLRLGASVYEQQCAQCHGAQGQGSSGAFPALAGNRAVLLSEPDNLVQMVLHGGYAPATAGNPRPHGMPPFLHVLGDAEVAAVLSYVRGSWGNGAAPVSAMDVYQRREGRR